MHGLQKYLLLLALKWERGAEEREDTIVQHMETTKYLGMIEGN